MVLIKVKTIRYDTTVGIITRKQIDPDTDIKNILPSDVMRELDKFNVSLSLSYPGREDIEISPTIDSLKNDNITKLFSKHIITSENELKIRIRMKPPPTAQARRAVPSATPTAQARRAVPSAPNVQDDEDDDPEAYGGGLRSSKRRKSKKRKSKRKSKRRSKKSKRRKSKRRRSR